MTLSHRLRIAFVLVFTLGTAHAQMAGNPAFASVTFGAIGHPDTAIDVVWDKQGLQDGLIDVDLDAPLSMLDDGVELVLDVRPSSPGSKVTVRQRSVSYLNVGEDGPHMAVAGTDRRSRWAAIEAIAPGRFRVQKPVRQTVPLVHALFVKAFADNPSWIALADTCKSPDEGACYTVTDPEFEVAVTAANGQVTRKIIRVTYPNGC